MPVRWLSLWCLVATPTFCSGDNRVDAEDRHQQEFPGSGRSVLRLLSLRSLLQRSTVYIANHCAGVTSATDYLEDVLGSHKFKACCCPEKFGNESKDCDCLP